MVTITRDELAAALDQPGTVLIETLPAEQYEAEHLPGAINVPGDLDPDIAAQLAPDKTALVVSDMNTNGPAYRRIFRSTSASFAIHLALADPIAARCDSLTNCTCADCPLPFAEPEGFKRR